MLAISEKDGAITFRVRVQPRASKSAIAGLHGGALKVRIASPPVDGKANDEVRRFIARLLDVPVSSVEIVAGLTSRDKVLRVHNVEALRVRSSIAGA